MLFLSIVACVDGLGPSPATLVPVQVSGEAGASCAPAGIGLKQQHLQAPPEVRAGPGVAVADFDADGLLDLFVPYHRANQLWLGTEAGFVDATDQLIKTDILSEGVSAVDYDADGDVDVFVGSSEGSYLFTNDGTGHFRNWVRVSDKAALSIGGAWGDVDGDGALDLLICNHSLSAPTREQLVTNNLPGGDGSQLLLSDQRGRFVEVSERISSVAPLYPNTCLLQDLDNDHDLDLYMVNDYGPWSGPNQVLWNDGEGFFEEEDGSSGLEVTVMGMGVAVASMDGGPLPSLLLSSWGEVEFIEPLEGGWVDTTAARGFGLTAQQQVAWGVAMPDVDNDGDLDAAATFGALEGVGGDLLGMANPEDQPDALFRQEGGYFSQVEDAPLDDPGAGRGLVAADLDRNGSMDLVVHSLDDGTHVYLNDCPDQHWVVVSLEQPGGNRPAIGARVELEAGGRKQVQWVHAGGTSMASSGPAELHFGLGSATQVDRIRVIWPDGEQSKVEAQPVDFRLHLSRD